MTSRSLPVPAAAFSPNPAQRRLLLFMHENPGFKTALELCAAAGVGRSTYYRWCQESGFRLWFADAWGAHLLMDGAALINIARLQAARSFSYWKALMELTFDEAGLARMRNWRQALAHVNPDSFEPAPSAIAAPAEPENVPARVPPVSEPLQSLTPENGTDSELPSHPDPDPDDADVRCPLPEDTRHAQPYGPGMRVPTGGGRTVSYEVYQQGRYTPPPPKKRLDYSRAQGNAAPTAASPPRYPRPSSPAPRSTAPRASGRAAC